MISLELRITLMVIVIFFTFLVLMKLKDKIIMPKYALIWMISLVGMVIAVCFPELITMISHFLGFETTSNMIFLLGFFILLCIVFGLTLIISKQNKEITVLIQQLSILTYRFENETEEK